MMPLYFLCSDIILVETVKQNYVTAHATDHKVDRASKCDSSSLLTEMEVDVTENPFLE